MKALLAAIVALGVLHPSSGDATAGTPQMSAFFKPYVETNNLSGSVLVQRGKTVLFSQSYGFADREKRVPNGPRTRFHVASVSILFTSTAILRLIDRGKLSFDTRVSDIVQHIPNGDRITIRELLNQNSGLPDANDLPGYEKLLLTHQTPQSLVAQIQGLPPYSNPGGESQREEHSGQNLLALILERKTGLTFAQAMKREVFDPFGMHDSGIDDDSPIEGALAQGYQLDGTFGLKRAPAIHWSALPGNGSAYTTVLDEEKWIQGVLGGKLLSESSRRAVFATHDACGWETYRSKRLGETVYLANGRVIGFSGIVMYLPRDGTAIIAFTNIEHDSNLIVIPNLALMLRGKPYVAFHYDSEAASHAGHPSGDFRFGKNFFRPSATLRLRSNADGTTMYWGPGRLVPLIPLRKDTFMDRYYWSPWVVIRGRDGHPIALEFSNEYRGVLVPQV